ncbi:hypothetical protein H5T89_00965, partial [bacterium]|nr:hypothetical protein [bacterium]
SNLRDIHVTDKEIRFTVERTPFKTKYVLVNGLKSLPKSVSVGGENVRQTKDIEISEKGWKYEKGSLVIKINSSLDTGIILSF